MPARRAAPASFLWGTAISAHQSEGGNVNSDMWLCENVAETIFVEPSRDACDSYHRYEEDIRIAAGLGFNCHRLGIEWARIEPEEGQFSAAALDHYRQVLEACHAHGLQPMITFSHFSVPRWFAARGGFEVADSARLFARFAARVTERLGDLIAFASTFNEANIQRLAILLLRSGAEAEAAVSAMLAACARKCGSERFSSLIFASVDSTEAHLLRAHREAMAAMKAGPGNFPVGLTLTMQDVQGVGETHRAEQVIDALYGPWIEEARHADFIGVNTYSRIRVDSEGPLPMSNASQLTGAGYEYYPAALAGTIRFAHERIGRPIYVTESGICTDDDAQRVRFIDEALDAVRTCMDEGIPVNSFIFWSLLDNFEWTHGYHQRFGLVEVDRETFVRTPKPSAHHLGAIARSGLI